MNQLVRRGTALHLAGDYRRAVSFYKAALERDPYDGVALYYFAIAAYQLREWDVAIRQMARAAELMPFHADAHYNLAKFLQEQGHAEPAEKFYLAAIAIKPGFVEAHINLGNMAAERGNFFRAEAHWDEALALEATTPEAHYNRAFVLLRAGRLVEGFREHDWRWKCPAFAADYDRPDQMRCRPWEGEPMADPLLLHAEQGLGDTIQFARYVPLVLVRCPRVILEVQGPLITLMRAAFPTVEIVSRNDPIGPHAAHCSLFSLPRIFGTTLETIPEPLRIPA